MYLHCVNIPREQSKSRTRTNNVNHNTNARRCSKHRFFFTSVIKPQLINIDKIVLKNCMCLRHKILWLIEVSINVLSLCGRGKKKFGLILLAAKTFSLTAMILFRRSFL